MPGLIVCSSTASARNDAAFTAKAAVAPVVAISAPPSADPAVMPISITVPARAEALAARSGVTSAGKQRPPGRGVERVDDPPDDREQVDQRHGESVRRGCERVGERDQPEPGFASISSRRLVMPVGYRAEPGPEHQAGQELQRDYPAQRPPVKLDDHPGQRHHLRPGARHGWQLAGEVPPERGRAQRGDGRADVHQRDARHRDRAAATARATPRK